jgi:molybdenum cofactor cytidylyltransferase
LPFGGATLLGHTLGTARECGFDQLVCVIGGGVVDEIRAQVDLSGAEVVENHDFGQGCSSSIALALDAVDERTDVLVLLLGDQPGVTPQTVRALLAALGDAPLALCGYDNGRGHPFAFARTMFGELSSLHGDKGVWKLQDRYESELVEVPIAGPIPPDVDTWEDYEAVSRAAPASSPTG